MLIVLHQQVSGLGNRGDVLEVADGYARNYLIPKQLAQQANSGIEAQAQAMRKAWSAQNAKNREAAEEVATALVSRVFNISARASGEGKLFGSVTATDIVAAVQEQSGVELDRKMIDLSEPIREIGTHSVVVRPHSEVQFPVTVEVVEV